MKKKKKSQHSKTLLQKWDTKSFLTTVSHYSYDILVENGYKATISNNLQTPSYLVEKHLELFLQSDSQNGMKSKSSSWP